MATGSGKIIIVLIVFLFLSSVAGVVIWGASTNWWSPESTGPSGASRPSGAPTPAQAPGPSGAPAPAPAPTTVTINGQTFDPSGYTVSKGFFGNNVSAAPSLMTPSASDCRQRCVDTTDCTRFQRSENTTSLNTPERPNFSVQAGTCFFLKNSGDNNTPVTVTGIKNDGSNLYSRAFNTNYYYDSASYGDATKRVTMDIGDCVSNCTSNNSCVAWYYRTSDHPDPASRRTCVLHDDGAYPDKYREGLINK